MGREKSSADWLPAGWKVDVRVRKSGKKDKCYVDPSNEHKFFSKPEVLRYLKRVGIHHSVLEETENKSSSCCSPGKFVVKEALPEGLPAGWIKEIRVSPKGNKFRRDAYYIDPVNGRVFRSMKEVSYYLETGEMRRRAPKPKEQGSNNLEVGQDSVSSAAGTEEKIIAGNEAGKELIGNQSPSTDTAVMNNDSLPEARKLEQGNRKEISSGGSSPAAEVPLENLQEGNGFEETKCKKKKRNHEKRADLPRRTSKRLAGIDVDLSLESKLPTRGRRASGKQISEAEDNNNKNLANIDERGKRLRTGDGTDVKPENLEVLPSGDATVTVPEEHAEHGVPECEGDQKREVQPDLPFSELWKDPCIEFAIKTLTGAMPIEDENKITMNQGSSSNLPNVFADSIQELPSMDVWADPCFEFAVKTLTGDLPMDDGPTLGAMLKQPSSNSSQTIEAWLKQPSCNSSQTIAQNGVMLPGIRSGGFNHAGVSFRDSNVAETPQHKQQL